MKRFTRLYLMLAMALTIGLMADRALAQFTDEFIFCTDPSTPDTCRATAVPPNPDGTVTWDRSELGHMVCWGAGMAPQPTDCGFWDYLYLGVLGCPGVGFAWSVAFTFPGWDLAIDCAIFPPEVIPPGNFSVRYINGNCFSGLSACGKLILQ